MTETATIERVYAQAEAPAPETNQPLFDPPAKPEPAQPDFEAQLNAASQAAFEAYVACTEEAARAALEAFENNMPACTAQNIREYLKLIDRDLQEGILTTVEHATLTGVALAAIRRERKK